MRQTSMYTIAGLALCAGLGLAQPALAEELVRIGLQQEPTSLDPTSDATASIAGMLGHNVYESLTTVDETGTVHPDLATRWDISEDGLTYRFYLAEGVKFHDGTTFDAEDVKFTYERAMAEDSVNPAKRHFGGIKSVTVIDPLTVEFELNNPDAFFLFNVAQGSFSIVAPESIEANQTTPVGTGPFRFDSWTRGDRLTLVKNDEYRNADEVKLDRVEFRFISDPASASAALMAQEIDAYPGFGAPEMLPQFENDPRFKVSVGSTEGEVILAMNNSKAPFTDPRVRQAVNHALDRQEIIDGAMYGRAVPIGSFYPPHGPSYVDLTERWPHDTDKAKALFAEAGIEGSTMTIRVPPFPYATRSAEIIQAELAQAGIDAKVETVEWGFWLDEIYKKRNYDMTIIAHTSPNDLGNFAKGPEYFYGYHSEYYDDLWNRITTESDPATRGELEREAQHYLADNAVMGFLFQLPDLSIIHSDLEGFWDNSPVTFQPLAGVHWSGRS